MWWQQETEQNIMSDSEIKSEWEREDEVKDNSQVVSLNNWIYGRAM